MYQINFYLTKYLSCKFSGFFELYLWNLKWLAGMIKSKTLQIVRNEDTTQILSYTAVDIYLNDAAGNEHLSASV